jgi:hypothetical protein
LCLEALEQGKDGCINDHIIHLLPDIPKFASSKILFFEKKFPFYLQFQKLYLSLPSSTVNKISDKRHQTESKNFTNRGYETGNEYSENCCRRGKIRFFYAL